MFQPGHGVQGDILHALKRAVRQKRACKLRRIRRLAVYGILHDGLSGLGLACISGLGPTAALAGCLSGGVGSCGGQFRRQLRLWQRPFGVARQKGFHRLFRGIVVKGLIQRGEQGLLPGATSKQEDILRMIADGAAEGEEAGV